MTTYKGMNAEMTCRGFQYEVGKEYETETADVCSSGFHACEYPLDVFSYYSPNNSRFFEVEQSGELSRDEDDTKVASTKIKIGAEIGISGLVKAAVKYTRERTHEEPGGHATGYRGASSATGYQGAASATGECSAAITNGPYGSADATGTASVAIATGYCGRVRGNLGCAIVAAERAEFDGDIWPLLCIKSAIIDGEAIQAGVWYTVRDGEWAEWRDDE